MAKAKKQAKPTKAAAPKSAAASKSSLKTKPAVKASAKAAPKPVLKAEVKKGKIAATKIVKKVVKEAKIIAKPLAKTAAKAISQAVAKVEKTAKSLKKEVLEVIDSNDSPEVEVEAQAIAALPAVEKASKKTKISASQMEALNDDPAEMAKKWVELKKKHGGEKVASYAMTQAYEAQQALNHKIFGWGYILKSENDRLEVLFETGLKSLISNFKK